MGIVAGSSIVAKQVSKDNLTPTNCLVDPAVSQVTC